MYRLLLVEEKDNQEQISITFTKRTPGSSRGLYVFQQHQSSPRILASTVEKGGIPKIALRTRWGIYEFLVVPFGVSSALAQFIKLMNDVLADYLDNCVVVFLDNILICSKTTKDHAIHLRKVL